MMVAALVATSLAWQPAFVLHLARSPCPQCGATLVRRAGSLTCKDESPIELDDGIDWTDSDWAVKEMRDAQQMIEAGMWSGSRFGGSVSETLTVVQRKLSGMKGVAIIFFTLSLVSVCMIL